MADTKELIKDLGADQEVAYKAHKALLEMVTRATAPGSEARRNELAETLAAELTAKDKDPKKANYINSARVRIKLARLLSFVAGDAQVMALMDAIKDLEVQEMARFALDFNTSEAATKALILALDDVGPEFRIGVVGALARHRTPDTLKVLQQAAENDADPEVRVAAALALANFPEPANDAIIAKAPCAKRATVARIRLADTLRHNGKQQDAMKIYKSIESSDAAPAFKKAAKVGLTTKV